MISQAINKALIFSSSAHRNQLRKATDTPYISHPVGVGMILLKTGCRDELVIAGILHDCLEDTDATENDILKEFGPEVLELVKGATEPDHHTKSWQERKQHTIDYMKNASRDIKLVCCADKLNNLMCDINDFEVLGDKLWERFSAPMQDQVWYYSELAKSFRTNYPTEPLFKEFNDKVNGFVLSIKKHSRNNKQ